MALANTAAPADPDGDGMPDTWEQLHFGHPTNGDSLHDSFTDVVRLPAEETGASPF